MSWSGRGSWAASCAEAPGAWDMAAECDDMPPRSRRPPRMPHRVHHRDAQREYDGEQQLAPIARVPAAPPPRASLRTRPQRYDIPSSPTTSGGRPSLGDLHSGGVAKRHIAHQKRRSRMAQLTPAHSGGSRQTAADGWIWGYALLDNYRTSTPRPSTPTTPATPAVSAASGTTRAVHPGQHRRRHPNNEPLTPGLVSTCAPRPWVITVPAWTATTSCLPDLDTPYVGFVGARATGQEAGHYLLAAPAGAARSRAGWPECSGRTRTWSLRRPYVSGGPRRRPRTCRPSRSSTGCAPSPSSSTGPRPIPPTNRCGRCGGTRTWTASSSSRCSTSCCSSFPYWRRSGPCAGASPRWA